MSSEVYYDQLIHKTVGTRLQTLQLQTEPQALKIFVYFVFKKSP